MRRFDALSITVFIAGAAVMVFEIVGSRVVAPYLGTSTYVWTSIIGVILASLSLGYWYGGVVADRGADLSVLSRCVRYALLGVAWVIVMGDLVLPLAGYLLRDPILSAFVATLILFTPASVAFGMVAPLAAKMKIASLKTSGSSVGNLYALSTAGSIIGTFAAGYLLLPLLGTRNILILLLLMLWIISFALHKTRHTFFSGLAALVVAVAVTHVVDNVADRFFVADVDTAYNRIQVFDAPDVAGRIQRTMLINNAHASAIYPGSDELVFDYMKFFRVAEYFHPRIRRALMIGGAGYAFPRDLLARHAKARVDVVEIDPGLTKIARDYFGLTDDPRLRIVHEDARVFMRTAPSGSYDVLYGDVFNSTSVPFHVTTREFYEDVYRVLADDGIYVMNIIATLSAKESPFLAAEYKTLASVFPQVRVYPVQDLEGTGRFQNIIIVARKRADEPPHALVWNGEMYAMRAHEHTPDIPESTPILTDNFAPVGYYVRKLPF